MQCMLAVLLGANVGEILKELQRVGIYTYEAREKQHNTLCNTLASQ